MYQPLVPCPHCQRHVKTDEPACPFCSAALPSNLAARAIPGATQRLTRAAAFLFGASLTVAGCGTDVTTGSGSGGGSDPTGTTNGTTAATSGGASDAGPDDDGGVQPLYGDPTPIDGGPDDDGGGQAEYGAPPPMDGGVFDASVPPDDGGAQPLYGAPP